jgi:hypothetical protein
MLAWRRQFLTICQTCSDAYSTALVSTAGGLLSLKRQKGGKIFAMFGLDFDGRPTTGFSQQMLYAYRETTFVGLKPLELVSATVTTFVPC